MTGSLLILAVHRSSTDAVTYIAVELEGVTISVKILGFVGTSKGTGCAGQRDGEGLV